VNLVADLSLALESLTRKSTVERQSCDTLHRAGIPISSRRDRG
jgi:hypothetical protein